MPREQGPVYKGRCALRSLFSLQLPVIFTENQALVYLPHKSSIFVILLKKVKETMVVYSGLFTNKTALFTIDFSNRGPRKLIFGQ
jgi:hypothetical protein